MDQIIETSQPEMGGRATPKQATWGTFTTWRQFVQAHELRIIPLVGVVTLLILWEAAPALGWVKPIFTSSPSRIVQAAIWLFAHGLWNDIVVSLSEFGLGFGLALLFAIPVGIVLGWSRRLHALFDPFITALNATPRVALLPLIILWLGIGLESKVAIVFLGALFPLLINTIVGVQTLDTNLVRCARAFGASDRQILVTVALPTSIPFIIAGMRLGVGRGLLGVVVGELVAASAGVGYMMNRAGSTFQTDKVFVGVLLIAGFGYTLTEILKRIEAHVSMWRPQETE